MKIIFKIHFLFFISAFICFITGFFKNFIILTSIILIHECGHILIGLLLKWDIQKVIIFPFGGLTIFNTKINTNLNEELLVAISGVLFQTLFYFLLFNGNDLFKQYHILILLFNLIPIYPLDGSKVLNVFLNKIFPYKISYIITIIISFLSIMLVLIQNQSFMLILSMLLLISKVFNYYKEINISFNKLLLERYLYKLKYKKTKIISNINNIYKDKNHIIKNRKNIVKEEEILKKIFDSK